MYSPWFVKRLPGFFFCCYCQDITSLSYDIPTTAIAEITPSLPRLLPLLLLLSLLLVYMCTDCMHVYMCACVHACVGIAPRAVPEGCAARGPQQTSGRLRYARPAWGHLGSSGRLRCARPSGVIRKVALCAAFRGVISSNRSCAVRGSRGLRCARVPWKVSEGSARLRCARPRGSADLKQWLKVGAVLGVV